MPFGDPTAPIPESEMRILRPIGLVLAALFIGFNGAYLLLGLLEAMGGPPARDWVMPAACVASALAFALLLRRSRRKRRQVAQLAAQGLPAPPRNGRILLAGVLIMILAVTCIWLGLTDEPRDLRAIGTGLLMLVAGASAVTTVIRRRRESASGRGGPETENP